MPPKTKKTTIVSSTPVEIVAKQDETVTKPTKTKSIETKSVETIPNDTNVNLEQLKQEWLTVIQEITLIDTKREQLSIQRDELVRSMMKQMNSVDSLNPIASIIETPTIAPINNSDKEPVISTTNSKSKIKKETIVEVESSVVKKTKKQPAKKTEVAITQEEPTKPTKQTKKKTIEPEIKVSKTTKSKKVEPEVIQKAVSSSSDTDLESLSSCSSESECSGGDED